MATPAKVFRACRRFRVPLVEDDGWRGRFIDALNERRFVPPLSETSEDVRSGWVVYGAPLDTAFDDVNRWLFNHYVVLSLRVDQKKLPSKLFKAHLDSRIQAWCQSQNRERAPAGVKQELRDALKFEMLQKQLPTMRVFDVIWNVAEGWFVTSATATSAVDLLRKSFSSTFGLLPEAQPLAGGEDDLSRAGVYVSDLEADFLTWLLWKDGGNVKLGEEDVRFDVDDAGVQLEGHRGEKGPALLAALSQGKLPEALTLFLGGGNGETRLRMDGLMVKGMRLDVQVKSGDVAEMLYDATYCYERAWAELNAVFDRFLEERRGMGGTQSRAAVDRWVAEGMEPLREFFARMKFEE